MVKEIESFSQFTKEIESGRVLVDTYAVWCGPCRMLSPIVEEFSDKHPEISVIKVNIDLVEEVSSKYGIMAIPTLLYFENGKLINSNTGFVNLETIEKITKVA